MFDVNHVDNPPFDYWCVELEEIQSAVKRAKDSGNPCSYNPDHVIFHGPNSEAFAKEYAEWKKAIAKPNQPYSVRKNGEQN